MIELRPRALGTAAPRRAAMLAVAFRRGAALAVGALLAVALAGCAGQASGTGAADAQSLVPAPDLRSPGTPQVHPRWRSCAAEPQLRPHAEGGDIVLPPLGAAFHPVAAVMCRESQQRRPDGGLDAVAVEERADKVAALVTALRLPDDAPLPEAPPPGTPLPEWSGPPLPDDFLGAEPVGTLCTADGYAPPKLVLLDARGRWVRPGIPRDSCGKPRPEFTAALEQVRWTRVTTRVLGEIESAEAAASGCDQVYGDMVWTATVYPTDKQGELAPLAEDAAPVRMCVYRVAAGQQPTDKPRGDFVSGGLLPPGRWAAVRRHLQASGPAAPCTTPASRFALLNTSGGQIFVELDGCRRLLAPTVVPGDDISFDVLWQAPPALPALLHQAVGEPSRR
jgi:hypothetical protein